MKRKGSRRGAKGDEEENEVDGAQESGGSSEPSEKKERKSKGKGRKAKSKHESDSEESEAEQPKKSQNLKQKGSRKSGRGDDNENGVESAQENGGSNESSAKKDSKSKGKGRKSKSKHASDSEESDVEPPKKLQSSEEEMDPLADGDDEDDAEYEVEAILDEKMVKGVHHFLIRWKGYTEESDTWEPEETLECADLIKDFKEKNKKPKKEGKEGKKKSSKGEKKEGKIKEEDEETWDENEDFEVDRIIDVYFHRDGKRDFLVSWKGYPSAQNTWEPEDNMDCKDLIKKFMAKVEEARKVEGVTTRVVRKQVNRLAYSMHENDRKLSRRHRGKERVRYFDTE